jgi:endonuclease-3
MAATTDEKRNAITLCRRLQKAYPDARCRLNFSTPFELLVATILAAQCTDDKVNQVTADLFEKAGTPEDFAEMDLEVLKADIRPTGFYNNKAVAIQGAARLIVEEHGGTVPRDMDALTALPGVARKTANVVRAAAFGEAGIITDTHMIRVSQRLGLVDTDNPEKIERRLMELLPEKHWSSFSHAVLFHGRAVCTARKPACDECILEDRCPSAYDFPHFDGKKKGGD